MTYTDGTSVKAYLSITGTADDALIGTFVSQAQKIVESYTQRVFDGSGTSARYFDAVVDVDDHTLLFDEDVYSIVSVKNRADSATPVTIGTSGYVTLPTNRKPYYGIRLLTSGNNEWDYEEDPERGILVTASWRYSESAPADIVHATTRLAAFLYRQKDSSADLDRPLLTGEGVTILPSQIPHDVRQILEPYRKRYVR